MTPLGAVARAVCCLSGLTLAAAYLPARPYAAAGRRSSVRMLLELPAPDGRGLFAAPSWLPGVEEDMGSGIPGVEFSIEPLHLTKRRVKGGVLVNAPIDAVWETLTDFERLPDIIPSIVSHDVTRRPDGTYLIDQVSLLSRRMNLRTHMKLEAVPSPCESSLKLRRLSGHGFLEFQAVYDLTANSPSTTYLSYSVDVVPCPIFPLPVVEQKIRKEVPRMLCALRTAAQESLPA